MRPEDAPHIAKATRRQFPDGIPAYGTDALRFTFCALATNGRNIRFDLKRIEGYRNFCNKLWNAARYVLRSVDPDGAGTGRPAEAARSAEAERGASGVPGPQAMPSVVDRWIRSRLVTVAEQVRDGFESYRFDYVASSLYDFTWNEFCDWYVELTKPILAAPGVPEAARSATRRTLVEVFETLLRFLHPIMPFVTEDLWLRVAPAAGIEGETVMLQPWPEPGDADPEAETEVEWIKGFVLAVRNARGEMDIAPGRRIGVRLQGGDARDAQRVAEHRTLLESLARLEGFTWLEPDAPNPPGAAAFAGALKILLPFEGTVDLAAERARLEREIAKRVRDLGQVEAKLANEAFVARAPAPVVEKQRERAAELGKAVGRLQDQVERLAEAG